jgi:hypothetical protein
MRGEMKWAVAVLAIVGSAPVVMPQSGSAAKLSRADLRQMERSAHTAEQYEDLASYFRMRELSYHKRADAEMEEWTRRMQFSISLYAKYPAPADSSRNRYEYFKYEQRQMDGQAAHYENLAASAKE